MKFLSEASILKFVKFILKILGPGEWKQDEEDGKKPEPVEADRITEAERKQYFVFLLVSTAFYVFFNSYTLGSVVALIGSVLLLLVLKFEKKIALFQNQKILRIIPIFIVLFITFTIGNLLSDITADGVDTALDMILLAFLVYCWYANLKIKNMLHPVKPQNQTQAPTPIPGRKFNPYTYSSVEDTDGAATEGEAENKEMVATEEAETTETVADVTEESEKPRFCTNCGQPLSGDEKFCTNCGAKISE